MTAEEMRRAARAAGLERYAEAHPEMLTRALEGAARLTARLPRTLAPTDEPAHTLSAHLGKGSRP